MPRRPLDSPPQRRKATRPTVQLQQSPGGPQVLSANLPSTTTVASAPPGPIQQQQQQLPPLAQPAGPTPAEQVGWWLAAVNMQGFLPSFIAQGFDSLEACAELTSSDLPALGIHLMGHTRVMLSQIAQLKQRVASMAALGGSGGRGGRGARGGRGGGGRGSRGVGTSSNMTAALQTVSTVLSRADGVEDGARQTVRLAAPPLSLPESPQRPGLLQRAVDSAGALPLSALRDPFGADRGDKAFEASPPGAAGHRAEAHPATAVGLNALRGDDQAASYRSPASGLPPGSTTQLSDPLEASSLSAIADASPRSALLRRIETACRRYEAAMAAAVAGDDAAMPAGGGAAEHVRVIIDFCSANPQQTSDGVPPTEQGSERSPVAAPEFYAAASPSHIQHEQQPLLSQPRARSSSVSSEQTISYALDDDGVVGTAVPREPFAATSITAPAIAAAAPNADGNGSPPQRASRGATLTPHDGDSSRHDHFSGDDAGPTDLTAEAIVAAPDDDDSDSSVVEIEPRDSTSRLNAAAATSPLSRRDHDGDTCSQTPLRPPPAGAVVITDASPVPLQQHQRPPAEHAGVTSRSPSSRRADGAVDPLGDERGRSTTTRRRSTCRSLYTNDLVADPDAYVTFSRRHPSLHRKSVQRPSHLFRTPSERRDAPGGVADDDEDDAAAVADYDAGFGDGYEDYLLMQYSPPAEDDVGGGGGGGGHAGSERKCGRGSVRPVPNLGFTQDEPFVIDDDDDDDAESSLSSSFGTGQAGLKRDDASDASSSVLVASHQSARPQPRPAAEESNVSAAARAAKRLTRLPTRLKMRRMPAGKLRKAAQAAGLLPCAAPDAIPSDQRGTASPPIGTGSSTVGGDVQRLHEHEDPRERRRLQFLLATALARRQFQTAVLPALSRVVADGGDGRLQVDQSGAGVAPGADRRQVVQRRKEEAERGLARSIVAALVLHSIEERVERVAGGVPGGGGGGPSDLGPVERSLLREDVVVEDVLAIAQRSLPSLVRAPIERLLKSSAVSSRLGQPDRFNAEPAPGSPADGATPRTTQRQAPAASRWWRGGRGRGGRGRGVGIS